MSTNSIPNTGADQAAAAAAAAAERKRLAEEEAKRAADAAAEAKGTGQEQVYFDKPGALDRDTVAKNDADLMANYDKYAQADGSIKEEDFEKLYAEVHGGDPIKSDLRPDEAQRNAVADLADKQANAKTARTEVEKLDEELNAELQQAGGTLTDQQKADFEVAWKDKHGYAKAEAESDKAHKELNDFLADPKTADLLKQGMIDGNVRQDQVMDGLAEAAEGKDPKAVVDFVTSLLADPAAAASHHLTGSTIQAMLQGPVAKAAQNMAVEAASQAAGGGKPTDEAVAEAFEKISGPLQAAAEKYGANIKAYEQAHPGESEGPEMRDKKDAYKAAAITARTLGDYGKAIRSGNKAAVKAAMANMSDEVGVPGLKGALAGVGVVAGTVALKDAFNQGDYAEMLKQGILTAPDLADAASGVFKAVAQVAGKYKGVFEAGGELVEHAGYLATGVAGLVGALADAGEAIDGNNAKWGAAAGNAMVSIGGFVSFANPAVGGVLIAAGLGVNVTFNLINANDQRKKLWEDLDLLSTFPDGRRVNDETIAWLKAADKEGTDAGNATKGLGLSAEQFQQLLHDHPEWVATLHGDGLAGFTKFAGANYRTNAGAIDPEAVIRTLSNVPPSMPGRTSPKDRVNSAGAFLAVTNNPALWQDRNHTLKVDPSLPNFTPYYEQYMTYVQAQTMRVFGQYSGGGGAGVK